MPKHKRPPNPFVNDPNLMTLYVAYEILYYQNPPADVLVLNTLALSILTNDYTNMWMV